jgi:hypothetical protein
VPARPILFGAGVQVGHGHDRVQPRQLLRSLHAHAFVLVISYDLQRCVGGRLVTHRHTDLSLLNTQLYAHSMCVCVCASLGDSRVWVRARHVTRVSMISRVAEAVCACVCICMYVRVHAYVCVCVCVSARGAHLVKRVTGRSSGNRQVLRGHGQQHLHNLARLVPKKLSSPPHPPPHPQSAQTSVRDFKGIPHADTSAHTSLLSQQQQVPMRCVCASSTHPQTHTHTHTHTRAGQYA